MIQEMHTLNHVTFAISNLFDHRVLHLQHFLAGAGGKRIPPPLPDRLIVGYANWDQCDDTVCY